jgi:hypothetical protein
MSEKDSQPFDRKYVEQALRVSKINPDRGAPFAVMTYACQMCLTEVDRLEAENKATLIEVRNQKDYVLLMHDRLSIPCHNMNRMSIELRDARKEIASWIQDRDSWISRYEDLKKEIAAKDAKIKEIITAHDAFQDCTKEVIVYKDKRIQELEASLANEQLWWSYATHPEGGGMVAMGERRKQFEAEGKKLDPRWADET